MQEHNLKWAVIGSTNMCLQGMDVEPQDLDIIVELETLDKLKNIFADYEIAEKKQLKPGLPVWEFQVKIDDVEFQFIGEKLETAEYIKHLLANEIVEFENCGLKIPCFTLEAEAQAYEETNRQHKADIIKEFVKNL